MERQGASLAPDARPGAFLARHGSLTTHWAFGSTADDHPRQSAIPKAVGQVTFGVQHREATSNRRFRWLSHYSDSTAVR